MNTKIEQTLLKAKIEIMTRSVFISTIVLGVKHKITNDIPNAATDGSVILYNPDFIAKQNPQQLAGLMAHECWHIVFQHMTRRMDRDPIIWNVAGDYVINLLLTDAAFQIPDGGLLDTKYAGMSTDEVYNSLIDEQADYDPSKLMLDILAPGEGEQESKSTEEVEAKIKDILVRAYTQAKMADDKAIGNLPGEVTRHIEDLINPRLPWQVLLNRFLDVKTREEYSWNRRNRRYSDVYMPSMQSYGLGHLTFAIDTSGSISDEELRELLSELQGIQRTFLPEKMTIIDCDSSIKNVYEIDGHTDILSLEFSGGGGTRFKPVLEYVTEHPTTALVYFTDLYGETDLDEVDYPVLWVCTSDHKPSNIGDTVYIN